MEKMSRVTFCAVLLFLMDEISARVIAEGSTKGRTPPPRETNYFSCIIKIRNSLVMRQRAGKIVVFSDSVNGAT